jgi:hypothetical protein
MTRIGQQGAWTLAFHGAGDAQKNELMVKSPA